MRRFFSLLFSSLRQAARARAKYPNIGISEAAQSALRPFQLGTRDLTRAASASSPFTTAPFLCFVPTLWAQTRRSPC
ncbi:hypothetical protein B0H63DRAFT_469600 [Podospora didyma]|uniref:Uncharacterized protein n=1 Tax=Podospora didyma TaxID=330526 RepID=A0AAE0NT50_9PEZI|nr:hypothetical protein B0H63DRAFT_469600 [Podospora didyma]